MAPETIEPWRVAVLRGRVSTPDGAALPGVTITIVGHPEYGQTRTRSDAMFDLAVNGGGPLTVRYETTDYLPAERQVQAPLPMSLILASPKGRGSHTLARMPQCSLGEGMTTAKARGDLRWRAQGRAEYNHTDSSGDLDWNNGERGAVQWRLTGRISRTC